MDELLAEAPIAHDVKIDNFGDYAPDQGCDDVDGWLNELSKIDQDDENHVISNIPQLAAWGDSKKRSFIHFGYDFDNCPLRPHTGFFTPVEG